IEKEGWSGEVSGRRKDGSPITILITASLVKDEKGEPICMMDSFVDITERKFMEDELRIKDNAIASSLNGIVIGDLEGNITYVNDAFMELWGGDDISEIVGKSAVTFAEDEDKGRSIINVLQNEGNWTGEITGIRRDGIPITVQLSAGMVYNEKKEPICMMCSLVDITKRKEAEEKLQRSHEELEIRVQDRTKELTKANIKLKKEIEDRKIAENTLLKKEKELELKSLNLEEANTALKVLLRQGEKDKTELENKVLQNIKELVLPCIEKLKIYRLDDKQQAYLDILESNLNNIISPFLQKLSSKYMDFTPTEIQVANFVREGKPTKEIAELLNISERGIEFHRNNIRMKLGLKNRKTNLRTYLLSLA
ncbi:MAG: PAS domain S-box protein, partial [Syntrophobacterales bacterium]